MFYVKEKINDAMEVSVCCNTCSETMRDIYE